MTGSVLDDGDQERLRRHVPVGVGRGHRDDGGAAAATRAAGEQADAIAAYDRSLALVVGRLRQLHPPPVMAPTYRAQLQTLIATRAAGTALALELRKKNRSRVALLSRHLSEAARIVGTIASQQAEIAAIKAYDARVQKAGDLQRRIQNEVSRLSRTVG